MVTVLVVIVAGYAGVAAGWVLQGTLPGPQLALSALLTGLGVAHTEIVAGVARERAAAGPRRYDHADLTAVWTFAGVAILPPPVAAAVTMLVHLHLCWRTPGAIRHRQAYTNATLSISCLTAGTVLAVSRELLGPGGLLPVLASALVVYAAVHTALRVLAVGVIEKTWRWRSGDEHVELVALALGAVLAMLLTSDRPGPVAAVFLVPVLALLHRALSAIELEERADAEDPIGLLTFAVWFRRARREIRRASARAQPVGLLQIDVNGLSGIIGRHGQRVGDRVLRAVAESLDSVAGEVGVLGRQPGTDSIVMLLPGLDTDLDELARRMAHEVAALEMLPHHNPDTSDTLRQGCSGGLHAGGEPGSVDAGASWPGEPVRVTVCIGGAVRPEDGPASSLLELLELSEDALREARRRGPGSVRLGRRDDFGEYLDARRRGAARGASRSAS